MKIYPPIKNFKAELYPKGSVTQWFGENPALYKQRMGLDGHNGIDIVAPWGTPLFAVEGGIVAETKDTPEGYGKHLRILSEDSNSEWTYGHNSENLVKVGDIVRAGDHIANMGNTGFVVSGATPFWKYNPYAGTHLHLGRREIKFTSRGWRYHPNTPAIEVLYYNNGFKGAIDFREMLPDSPDDTIRGLQLTLISALNTLVELLQKKLALLKK